jgi:hypothetical protein
MLGQCENGALELTGLAYRLAFGTLHTPLCTSRAVKGFN